MKLDEMIVSIVEGVEKHLDGNYVNGVTFPDEIKELIHEAADKCRQTELYINTKNDTPEELKTSSASDLYMRMLVKIASAPTWLHAAGSPRLMLPLISDAIKREEVEDDN
jgi:hypothetical protein